MRKFELEQKVERLTKALSRAKVKIKKLSDQAEVDGRTLERQKREIAQLIRSHENLVAECEQLRNEGKRLMRA
jgi:hypothetical protein